GGGSIVEEGFGYGRWKRRGGEGCGGVCGGRGDGGDESESEDYSEESEEDEEKAEAVRVKVSCWGLFVERRVEEY
ncbi:hypothetical protein A2U01_0058366, partial [Trifolium medium]|nr:hypothetical protein [Trifolium medium]